MSKESPKITVVTVCRNAVNDIERTIQSVLNQTFSKLEYIIIDGASTDGTVDVIKKYADRLTYFVSEPDNGIYDAMNKGIKHATGEWINFMNAGDRFVDDDTLSSLLDKMPVDIRILRGNIIRVYPKFKVKSVGVTSQEPHIMEMFHDTFHHQACLIQTSLFKERGLYSLEYRLASDWIFFYDCVILNKVRTKYVDKDVAYFEMDGTSSANGQRYNDERMKYLSQVYGEELSSLLAELHFYRKIKILNSFYRLSKHIKSNISPSWQSKLFKIKMLVGLILHSKVS